MATLYKVQKAESKLTKGKKEYLLLTLNEQLVSFFDEKDVQVLVSEGQTVTCRIIKNGNFKNGHDLKIADPNQVAIKTEQNQPSQATQPTKASQPFAMRESNKPDLNKSVNAIIPTNPTNLTNPTQNPPKKSQFVSPSRVIGKPNPSSLPNISPINAPDAAIIDNGQNDNCLQAGNHTYHFVRKTSANDVPYICISETVGGKKNQIVIYEEYWLEFMAKLLALTKKA